VHYALVISKILSRLRARASNVAFATGAAPALAIAANGSRFELATAYVVPAVTLELDTGATAVGTPKSRIKLLPIGVINCRDGRVFRVDDLAHAEAVVAASVANAGNCDIPIDFDHQLVTAPKAGGQAPASGWITALSAEPDGIWANVTWTEDGFARLSARAYRYISPAMRHDKSGRVLRIDHAGLVNEPAITELPAVAATSSETENLNVDLTQIAAALGLPATATMEDILAAITGMKPDAMEAAKAKSAMAAAATLASAATALGLGADADASALATAAVAAITAAADPAKNPLAAVVDTLRGELATLSAERRDRVIADAVSAGKLSPAMVPWARDYLAKDAAGFDAWLATAAVIVTPGETLADPLATAGTAAGLTAAELAIASAMNLSPEAFADAKKKG
jgi:phage I-like protein